MVHGVRGLDQIRRRLLVRSVLRLLLKSPLSLNLVTRKQLGHQMSEGDDLEDISDAHRGVDVIAEINRRDAS